MAQTAMAKSEESFIAKSLRFLTEVRVEVRKVTWPTRDELKKATVVIIAFVTLLGAVIGVMDALFQAMLVTGLARLFGG